MEGVRAKRNARHNVTSDPAGDRGDGRGARAERCCSSSAGSRWTAGPVSRPIPPTASISPPSAPPAIAPMARLGHSLLAIPPLRHPHRRAQGIPRWHPSQPRDAKRRPLARRCGDRGPRRLFLRPTMTARDGDAMVAPAVRPPLRRARPRHGHDRLSPAAARPGQGARRRHRRRCGRRNLRPLSGQGQQGRARRHPRRATAALHDVLLQQSLSCRLARLRVAHPTATAASKPSASSSSPRRAAAIDPTAKTVRLESGETLAYDKLVVAPGIDLKYGSIEGYSEARPRSMPHAWKAGAQTTLLRSKLEAMPDGGLFVITAPPSPTAARRRPTSARAWSRIISARPSPGPRS